MVTSQLLLAASALPPSVMLADSFPWKSFSLYMFFFVVLIIFHIWEIRGPRVIEVEKPGVFRKGWFADFTSVLIHGPLMQGVLKILAIAVILMIPEAMYVLRGDSWWWLILMFLLYFFVNDFGRYWLHRWYHESDFLWRFHRVHHSATEMSSLTTFRLHLFEAIPKYLILVVPFRILGIDPIVIIVYSVIDLIKGVWHHANIKTHAGKHNLWLNTAELHWWHHSVEVKGQLANYGSTLSIWDRIFGTFYWPEGKWPDKIGVAGIEEFPETYWGRQLSALRSDDEFGPVRSLEEARRLEQERLAAKDETPVPMPVDIAQALDANGSKPAGA